MNVAPLGQFALSAALVTGLYGLAAGVLGLRRGDPRLVEASRRAVLAWTALTACAALALEAALLTRQFHLAFVAQVSSRDLPILYTIAAWWGGHAGSLLLWAMVLGLYAVAAQRSLRRVPEFAPVVDLVLLAVMTFFSALLVGTSNPFAEVPVPPPDGRGLNPLLRNPWMAVHPPALYLGFVGMTVPFALGIAALVTRRIDATWTTLARRWVLVAWLALTLGLLFGAKWSYVVLGWGGYWAWDPVENAALMPWLAATAFLHSIQVQERRGLLAGWNLSLIVIAFALSIFGTFLTRSGIVSSVHAFASSSIGALFLGFLAVTLVGSFGLLLSRGDALNASGASRSGRAAGIDRLLSRETAFLANNMVLLVAAAVVFAGTVFPVVAEAVTGDRLNVGPPYFNQTLGPVVVLLLALMGIGPLLPWGAVKTGDVGRIIAVPAALGILLALLLAAAGLRSTGLLLAFALCGFVAATVGVEFQRGMRPRRARGEGWVQSAWGLVAGARRRYGGYVVHLGILLILAGLLASTSFATQSQVTLTPGAAATVGRYTLRFLALGQAHEPGARVTTATLAVSASGRSAGTVQPRTIFHLTQGQSTAAIGLRSTWRDDLYVVLVGWSGDPRATSGPRATFRILVNPLVMWVWTGGVVVVIGAAIAVVPARRRDPVILPAAAPAEAVTPVGESS